MRNFRAVLAGGALAAVASLALVPATASAAAASPASPARPAVSVTVPATARSGHVLLVTHTRRAGTCTLGIDYAFVTGLIQFKVTSYTDHCSGGGTMKYQAKLKTQIGTYFYGPWVNTVGASSQANSDVAAVLAGYKYNENNPVAVTCWVTGQSRSGSC